MRTRFLVVTLFAAVTSLVPGAACRKKAAGADVGAPGPAEEAATGAPADAASGGEPRERVYLLEKVGDYSVIAMYPDGFETLSAERRILAYHLYRAAIAGDAIFYDQRYRHNLEVKGLFEALVRNTEGLDPVFVEKAWTYLKLFWINHGIHDGVTGGKTIPRFAYGELQAAVKTLAEKGVEVLGTTSVAAALHRLEALRGPIFDPEVDPYSVRKSIPEGADLLTASSNGFYEGVTMADLAGFTEQHPLNSRLARRDGALVEIPYRAGGDGIDSGLYADVLRKVIRHLEDALPYAGEKQKEALGHLIRYFRTGDPGAFREYNIAWVADDPPVDAILGFIEVYADPRGRKGAWEGVVFFPDPAAGEMIRKLAHSAAYFESKMPYDERYRRTEFNPPVANVVISVVHTGDAGPISPAGINLPNEQAIRERYGSKSIDIGNVGAAVDEVTGELAVREFSFDEAERDLGLRCRQAMRKHIVGFHEVVGHGSGRKNPALEGDPADHLPGYYGAIEEARADLVALHLAFDPKAVEIGSLPSADCAVAVGQWYLRNGLLVLRRLSEGGVVEGDHWRATMLIVRYAIEKGAARIERRDGKFYFVMNDPQRWRAVVAELLGEVMRIKAEGDLAAAKALVDAYGSRYEPEWRRDVMARVRAIDYPLKYAFVSPILRPIRDGSGRIVDVVAEPAPSLAEMEWEWNRLAAQTADR